MYAMCRILAVAGLFLVPGVLVAAEGDKVPLKKGERIVFLGDSITAAGVGSKGYVTLIKNDLARSTRIWASRSSARRRAAAGGRSAPRPR